jgi:hypothetical protein
MTIGTERGSATNCVERAHVEELLDQALMQTFPASDPITLKACSSPGDVATADADPVPHGSGVHDGHADLAPVPSRPPAAAEAGR